MTKHPLDDLEAEIRDHIERETEDNIARGLSPAAARAAALRRFGNATLVREDARRVWVPVLVDQAIQDARYALRMMRRQPGFSLGVIAMLTIGLGLLSGGYTVFNGLFIRGWTVPDSDRVFVVNAQRPDVRGGGYVRDGFSAGAYSYIREHATAAEYVASNTEYFRLSPTATGGPHRGTHLGGTIVSDNFIEALRIPLEAGTGFGGIPSPAHTRVVISYSAWQRVFGGDPAIAGRDAWVNGVPVTIVGVTARSFDGLGPRRLDVIVDMASPLVAQRHRAEEDHRNDGTRCCLMLAGRVRGAADARHVREELDLLTRQYRTATRQPALAVTLGTTAPGDGLRASPNGSTIVLTLGLLGAAIVLVLLLTCANVGNLYLARSLRRQREIATRLSLGASRARVVRQLLTEGLVMAGVAGLCAFGMTAGVPPLLYLIEDNATSTMFASDWRVAVFTVAGVAATCLLVALAPALQTTRIRWRGAAPQLSPRAGRVRGVVLATQIAIAAVLVTSAALLMRGIVQATRVDADFALHTTTAITLSPVTRRSYSTAELEHLRGRLADALASSGLEAGVAGVVPASTAARLRTSVRPAGSEMEFRARFAPMSAAAARVLDLQLVAGRWPSDHPRDGEALINERLAREAWPGANPVGQSFTLGYSNGRYTVAGVTRDAHLVDLSQIEAVVHVPLYVTGLPVVLARTTPDLEPRITALMKAVDPQLAVSLAPLSETVKETLGNAKTGALIAATLGAVALLLSILGVFGVFSYLVEERRQEVGIRLALGATRRQIGAALFGATRGAIVAGLAAGLALSIAAGMLLRGFLFGLSPIDPVSYAAVAAVLGVAALLATAVPVRRALRVDPAVTLRAE